ncbi:hypothetical protein GIB67_028055, partial [Kingdonia uniflora]
DSITKHPRPQLHFHFIAYTLESLHTKQDTSCNYSNKIRDPEKLNITYLAYLSGSSLLLFGTDEQRVNSK